MTTDEQRIFVCEKLLGWKDCRERLVIVAKQPMAENADWLSGVAPSDDVPTDLPPLTLDWLHGAEMKLDDAQFSHYVNILTRLVPGGSVRAIVSSSSEQRLAALVETLGGKK